MTRFLVRRFIRAPEDTASAAGRRAYGRLSGAVGIALNLLLAAAKFAAGLAAGSISVTADAFNNLFDAGSALVTLAGFHLAGKEADAGHPFGHGRIEYLSGLLVSGLILLVGVELFQSSLERLLHPAPVRVSLLSAAILLLSVCVKLWLYRFNRALSRKISSAAMAATATDALADAVATAVLLAGLGAGRFLELAVDGALGLGVSLFILYAGLRAARDTIDPLLGTPADPELVRAIEKTVLAHGDISGVHDLVIHDYGPGRRMLSLHAEVSADRDLMAIHDLVDHVERELKGTYDMDTVIHADPVCGDETTLRLRAKVSMLAHAIDPALRVHDFRVMTHADHTDLLFDLAMPHGFRLGEEELKAALREAVAALDGTYRAQPTISYSYTE